MSPESDWKVNEKVIGKSNYDKINTSRKLLKSQTLIRTIPPDRDSNVD